MECGIGDRGSGFGMGIIGSIGVWRFSIGDWGFGIEIGDSGLRLHVEDGNSEFDYQTLVGYAIRKCGWRLEIRNFRLCMRYGLGIVNGNYILGLGLEGVLY